MKEKLESNRGAYELDYFSCKSLEFIIGNQDYIKDLKKGILDTKKRWYKELSKSKKFTVYDSKGYVLRLYSEDKKLVKETYDNLYDKRIVVGMVDDRLNLVFSVTNNKEIEGLIFDEIFRNN